MNKLSVDFYAGEGRSAALAAWLNTGAGVSAAIQIQGAGQCSSCGAHAEALALRGIWQEDGEVARLSELAGYCPDCVAVADLSRADMQDSVKATTSAAWLAAVNDWNYAAAADYLLAEMQNARTKQAVGLALRYETGAAKEVDLFEEPALDSGEDWESVGAGSPVTLGGEVEEEIGELEEIDTLEAVNEAKADNNAPSLITYEPAEEVPAVEPATTPVSPVAPSSPSIVEVKSELPQSTPVKTKTSQEKVEEAASNAGAHYYGMTVAVQRMMREKAVAAWDEAHRSTAKIQHVLWTRYHGLALAGYGKAKSNVRTFKKPKNSPSVAVIELAGEEWRLQVLNDYPGHNNIWELGFRKRGSKGDWDALHFRSESHLMEYFAQHVHSHLVEGPSVETEPVEAEQDALSAAL
jgi:hypothetical protein